MAGRLEGFVPATTDAAGSRLGWETEPAAFSSPGTGTGTAAAAASPTLGTSEVLGVKMAESRRRLMLPPFSNCERSSPSTWIEIAFMHFAQPFESGPTLLVLVI